MYIKCVPNDSEEGHRRAEYILEADEVAHETRYPLDYATFTEILANDVPEEWAVFWSLPLEKKDFPVEGIQLVILNVWKRADPTAPMAYVKTYLAFDCTIYVMSNEGKTIDRIN